MDVDIHQVCMQLFSGQDDTAGQAPFFQPTAPPPPPPQPPMMGMGMGGCQWAVDPVALPPLPMQTVCAGNALGLAPGEGSLTAAVDAFLGDDQSVKILDDDLLAMIRMSADELSAFLSDGPAVNSLCVPPEYPMRSSDQTAMADSPYVPPAGGASQPASGSPGEGSLTAGVDAFVGDDQPVDGFDEDLLAMMRMSGDELSAFLSDGPAVNSLCMPPEYPMRSSDQTAVADSPSVPPAGGASQPASGSPGEGSLTAGVDAFVGDDQPVDGFDEDLLAMMRMSGDELSAFLSDGPAVNSLCMPPEYPMRSSDQTAVADSPSVPPAGGASQPASGSPGLGCAQARATDSPASGVVELSAFLSDGAAANCPCVPPECLMNSLVAYQPAMDDSPPVHPADGPSQPAMGIAYPPTPPAAYLDAPQQAPDGETAEVARMVRSAERCGDRPSTAWSVEEDQLLIQDLSRFADEDNVYRCFSIASQLAEKTALDVAYRIRWMTDLKKKKAAKEVQLGQEKPAGANVTKGKGTKVANNKKNNKHPLSKEALDSRSAKDIIRDNNRLMDKIEEILRTGEVNNCPDYFYYVKMNMDVMQNKVNDLGSVMEGLSVGDEEWEGVLKDHRDTPQAGEDAATPAP